MNQTGLPGQKHNSCGENGGLIPRIGLFNLESVYKRKNFFKRKYIKNGVLLCFWLIVKNNLKRGFNVFFKIEGKHIKKAFLKSCAIINPQENLHGVPFYK